MLLSSKSGDEYDFDSSDEEDVRNTVGNIPLQWYDSLAHIGYDTSGRPIMKPDVYNGKPDAIDEFLRNTNIEDNGSGVDWRCIRDPQTGQLVLLSDADLEIVDKSTKGEGITVDSKEGPFETWEEWFTKDVMDMPLTAHPPQKRSFIPSLLDRRRVGRMVHAIKSGWLVPKLPSWALSDPNNVDELRRYGAYMASGNPDLLEPDYEEGPLSFSSFDVSTYIFPDVWSNQDNENDQMDATPSWKLKLPMLASDYRPPRPRPYQRAPEEPLPGHIASYNPPPEFLLSKDEEKKVMKVWRERVRDGHVSRVPPQMPRKFSCLRHVPFSERYLYEREERVKDLIMAARFEKQRVSTTPEAMLPPIPSLSQLRPYPSHIGLQYSGHTGRVTSLSISPCGQWLASISPSDGYLRIWETSTNYCFRAYRLSNPCVREKVKMKQQEQVKVIKEPNHNGLQMNDDDEEVMNQPSDDEENWSPSSPTACISWNPNSELHLLAAAIGTQLFIINPALGDRVRVSHTETSLLKWWSEMNENVANISVLTDNKTEDIEETDANIPSKQLRLDNNEMDFDDQLEIEMKTMAKWTIKMPPSTQSMNKAAKSKTFERHRIIITVLDPIISLDWHPKGDYLLTLSRPILSSRVRSRSAKRLLLHRLSKMSSQTPFSDTGKPVEWKQAGFHPTGKPHLFIASPRAVRIYDLVEQRELRCLRLESSSNFISSMALHPSGDHLVVGSYDSRFNWFDIELGNVPFKKLQLNHGAIRQLAIHNRRPLVSVALSDGTILIIHGKVIDDLLSKPVVIPVQLIRTGQPSSQSNVFSTVFHPRQPHVYSGGEDGSIKQFVAWK
ncbi:Ribosome biogenesis protein BOP1 like [Schistosoma japonicum]|nr:Ribosome biogenesis protein BOP1 like [Schistosoma japonicum]